MWLGPADTQSHSASPCKSMQMRGLERETFPSSTIELAMAKAVIVPGRTGDSESGYEYWQLTLALLTGIHYLSMSYLGHMANCLGFGSVPDRYCT